MDGDRQEPTSERASGPGPSPAAPQTARAWLRRRLLHARSVSIAVGYLSLKGLRRVLDVLRPLLLREGVSCRVLYGRLYDEEIDPHALRAVRRIQQEHGGALEIRGAKRPLREAGGPNLYLIERPAGAVALVGPSTLTGAGLDRDVARSAVLEDPATLAGLRAQFEAGWARGRPLPDPPAASASGQALLQQLRGAIRAGEIVEWSIGAGGWAASAVRAPAGRRAQALDRVRIDASGTVEVLLVPSAALRRLDTLRARGERALREISLRSPWGRFVPSSNLPLLPPLERALQEKAREAWGRSEADSAVPPEPDLADRIRRQLRALWPATSDPTAAQEEQVVAEAMQGRERWLEQRPRAICAQLRRAPAPEIRELPPPGASQEALRRDLVAFLVAAASAPRRALRDRRRPGAAAALCVLPDAGLEQAIALHDWSLMRRSPAPLSQIGLFSNESFQQAIAQLDAEVREIRLWYALELEEALERYAQLLAGR